MARLRGIPESVLEADLAGGTVTLALGASIYPRDAVYAVSYAFLDRCFVVIDQPTPSQYTVALSPKRGDADSAALEALAGGFANELLSAAYRAHLTEANAATIEVVTQRALASAMGPPPLDEMRAFDGASDDPFDDPLGVGAPSDARLGDAGGDDG